MKKTNLILILIAMLIFAACENNLDVITDTTNSDEEKISLRNLEDDILQAQLQWTSFVISGMLLEDDEVLFRDQFQVISESEGTILLSDLFADEIFTNRFAELIAFYFLDDPDTNANNATRPKNKPPKPPLGHPTEDGHLSILLNSIQSNECVEIYLPNALDFGKESLQILSTAHPLNNDDINDAYMNEILFRNMDVFDVDIIDAINDFVGKNINIIVARPVIPDYTVTPGSDCDYSQFEVDDFTEFLNGE